MEIAIQAARCSLYDIRKSQNQQQLCLIGKDGEIEHKAEMNQHLAQEQGISRKVSHAQYFGFHMKIRISEAGARICVIPASVNSDLLASD